MKSFNPITCRLSSVGLLFVALGSTPAAEPTGPVVAHARTAAKAPAKASPVEAPPPPVSTFVIPRKAAEGRDPFYPNSLRIYGESVPTNRPPVEVVADIALKGISGTTDQPLAIINSTTFTVGEVNEVILKNGRMRMQCVEINMTTGTVLMQIGSERRELRLGQKQ